MGKLFGTDGVRGVANKELTAELAYKLGRAAAYYLSRDRKEKGKKPLFLIGKDTRVSGDMLEAALAAGINSIGIDVLKLGIIPTSGVAYLASILEVDGAAMISASHNPVEDNGIKFFTGEGFKLSDQMEDEIEDIIFNTYDCLPRPISTEIGIAKDASHLQDKYIDYLLTTIDVDFSGLRIVLDCANGAAYRVAPEVLTRLGAQLLVINDETAGERINLNCGSTHPEVIREMVLKEKADLGIAHDGDADRVIMVDEQGQILDGDKIMAICSLALLKNNKLQKKTLVATAYSNLGLHELLRANGGNVVITENGDRYVLAEMLEKGYNLGGEQSGHIIFLDYNKTGDGVLTALQTIAILKKSGQKLSELASVMKTWPQRLSGVPVKDKSWEDKERIKDIIAKAEARLGDQGRVFVRASGTEPLIRVMLEGKDDALLAELEKEIITIIEEELN
ncbi:MAG TPA: phosphoglucosamine mutase [Halanaerobiales bacterium]|nr:phosphoglucosamine mutase [Halanaerobiales bacterium]HPZ63354.1 phosphoglucosamine mutase [Halanaerobiales bacterium]HQD03545.1 phosphoglucosamine mutase [Halanaerobiales bacterium]